MVVVLVVVSSVVLLVLVALYEQHRRRSVLEATIPVGMTRSARRKILRAHGVRVRSAQLQYGHSTAASAVAGDSAVQFTTGRPNGPAGVEVTTRTLLSCR